MLMQMVIMLSVKNELNPSGSDSSLMFGGMGLLLVLPINQNTGLYILDSSFPHLVIFELICLYLLYMYLRCFLQAHLAYQKV